MSDTVKNILIIHKTDNNNWMYDFRQKISNWNRHFARNPVKKKISSIVWISTNEQTDDLLTKERLFFFASYKIMGY